MTGPQHHGGCLCQLKVLITLPMEVHGAPLLLRVVLVHTVVHVPYPRLDVHDRVLLGVPGEDQLAGLVKGSPAEKI